MKAAFFLGNGTFEVREEALLHAGPGEVVIKNMACGVCGTDVHIFHGEPGSADVNPPVVLGHEYAGEVVEIGEGVTKVAVGDHVTVDPNIYCGKCRYCRDGKKQLCEHMEAIGVTRNGGFEQYSVVPEAQAFRLDKNLKWEYGAMTEPTACCLHGIDRADIHEGDGVVVIGGGAIGLIMMQLAHHAGASRIVVSEPVEERRQAALKLGATAAVNPLEEGAVSQVNEALGQEGADVVIECVGNHSAVKSAFAFAAKGATIVLFSVPKVEAAFELPLFDVYKKELTIRGSFVNPDTHQRAIKLIEAGVVDFEPIITHHFDLYHMTDAIQTQMGSASIKVMVDPWMVSAKG